MSKGHRRYTVVKMVRMSEEQAGMLSRQARDGRCSQSEWVRRLIEQSGSVGVSSESNKDWRRLYSLAEGNR